MSRSGRLRRAIEMIDERGGRVSFGNDRITVASLDGEAEVAFISVRDDPEVSVDGAGTGRSTASRAVVRIGDEESEERVDGTLDVVMENLGEALDGDKD